MVTSARSKEKQRLQEAEDFEKRAMANKILDEESQYLYCQQKLKEMNEKRAAKEKRLDDLMQVEAEKEDGEVTGDDNSDQADGDGSLSTE